MNGAMKDLLNVMDKFLVMGMSVQQVIEATTWKPARVIQCEDLGHLTPGAVADIALFRLRKGDFGFADCQGYRLKGKEKLECEMTFRASQVVYELNGLGKPLWKGD